MKLLISVLVLLAPALASASKLLTFNWQTGKSEVLATLSDKGLVFKKGEHQCQARIDEANLYEYGTDQFRLSLMATTSGCERLLGRNQRLEMEISNFDPQKKIAYPTRVITRLHDEAKRSESRADFLNSELLRSSFRRKVK